VTVLVVDDSAPIRSRLAGLLAELGGIAVEEAFDARSALECLRRARPDAVVLDIRLGADSGLQILQAIKRAPAPPMVIMLTNHPTEFHRRWCEEQGADFFFDKSCDMERVLDVLAERR
jgi:two-component system, NarL family, invasion response regulator UvrY